VEVGSDHGSLQYCILQALHDAVTAYSIYRKIAVLEMLAVLAVLAVCSIGSVAYLPGVFAVCSICSTKFWRRAAQGTTVGTAIPRLNGVVQCSERFTRLGVILVILQSGNQGGVAVHGVEWGAKRTAEIG
jgi:hypothetical protein